MKNPYPLTHPSSTSACIPLVFTVSPEWYDKGQTHQTSQVIRPESARVPFMTPMPYTEL